MKKRLLKVGEIGHLSDLNLNQRGKVLGLHGDDRALRRRLLDMGVTSGVTIQIKKIAPMGDPISIYLRGYELCVRLEDLKNIDIEVIE